MINKQIINVSRINISQKSRMELLVISASINLITSEYLNISNLEKS